MITGLWAIGIAMVAYTVGVGLFERLAPRQWVRAYQRAINPLFQRWTGRAHGWAVLETTGRKTGRPHRTPVGGRLLKSRTYWLVAGDAGHCDFVKNIQHCDTVRLRLHGRWRTGRATLEHDDPPRRRLLRLNPFNSIFVSIAARDPLSVRIDLDP